MIILQKDKISIIDEFLKWFEKRKNVLNISKYLKKIYIIFVLPIFMLKYSPRYKKSNISHLSIKSK